MARLMAYAERLTEIYGEEDWERNEKVEDDEDTPSDGEAV